MPAEYYNSAHNEADKAAIKVRGAQLPRFTGSTPDIFSMRGRACSELDFTKWPFVSDQAVADLEEHSSAVQWA